MDDNTNPSMESVGASLQKKWDDWAAKRQPHEELWIADHEQYHGKYPDNTEFKDNASQIFTNYTRPKIDYMVSRLTDVMFPADGSSHWSISSTPTPEAAANIQRLEAAIKEQEEEQEAQQLQMQAQMQMQQQAQQQQMQQQGAQGPQMAPPQAMPLMPQPQQPMDELSLMKQQKAEADKRQKLIDEATDNMSIEMTDQLKACSYQKSASKIIFSGFKLGTGVMKGPIRSGKPKKKWEEVPYIDELTGEQRTITQLMSVPDPKPSFKSVDLWNFYPDPAARGGDEFFDAFELHLMTKSKFRKLQHRDGFDKGAIKSVLQSNSTEASPNFVTRLNKINSGTAELDGDYYKVLEYTGCLEYSDFKTLAEGTNQPELIDSEDDPLKEYYGVVWVCNGHVLKFSVFPYDREEQIYQVFTPIPDESSLFGYSMTSTLRHHQEMLNASNRALLDNQGNTVGPQWLVTKGAAEPADGNHIIESNKVWNINEDYMGNTPPIVAIQVDSRQAEFAANMAIARDHMDQESSIPQQATGEPTGTINHTAMGTAILTNQGLIRYKMAVSMFDQQITIPNIRGLYDWNMQFNEREDIKGDMEVVAMGASSLLVRELQAQTLLTLMMQLSTHPIYGPMLKNKDLLKKVFEAHGVPTSDVMLSNSEIEAIEMKAEKAAEQGPPQDPAMELKMLELQQKDKAKDLDMQLRVAEMNNAHEIELIRRETRLIELASTGNIEVEKLDMKLRGDREKEMAKAREKILDGQMKQEQIASEAMVAAQTGVHAGGLV